MVLLKVNSVVISWYYLICCYHSDECKQVLSGSVIMCSSVRI